RNAPLGVEHEDGVVLDCLDKQAEAAIRVRQSGSLQRFSGEFRGSNDGGHAALLAASPPAGKSGGAASCQGSHSREMVNSAQAADSGMPYQGNLPPAGHRSA